MPLAKGTSLSFKPDYERILGRAKRIAAKKRLPETDLEEIRNCEDLAKKLWMSLDKIEKFSSDEAEDEPNGDEPNGKAPEVEGALPSAANGSYTISFGSADNTVIDEEVEPKKIPETKDVGRKNNTENSGTTSSDNSMDSEGAEEVAPPVKRGRGRPKKADKVVKPVIKAVKPNMKAVKPKAPVAAKKTRGRPRKVSPE